MDFLNQGIPLWLVLVWGVFMALVQALPRPVEGDAKYYVVLYRFLHGLSVNLKPMLDPVKRSPTAGPVVPGGG